MTLGTLRWRTLFALLTLGAPALSFAAPHAPAGDPAPTFDLRVPFWANLHQRLYNESSASPRGDKLKAADPKDQALWDKGVDAYRKLFIDRGFSPEPPQSVTHQLMAVENEAALAKSEVRAEVRSILAEAAPTYRRIAWPGDEEAGKALRTRLEGQLKKHGKTLGAAMARAFEAPWPKAPIVVDLVNDADRDGAYTVRESNHIVMSSREPRFEGETGLEVLFFQASQLLNEPLRTALKKSLEGHKKSDTGHALWKPVAYFMTGELVKRHVNKSYEPFAKRTDFYARSANWKAIEPVLVREWPARLDGKLSLESGADKLVAALP